MADIDIERRPGGPWPWIAALATLVGLVALALFRWGAEDATSRRAVSGVDTNPGELSVIPSRPESEEPALLGNDVLRSCADSTGDYRATADCLDRLASALEGVLAHPRAQGVQARRELARLRRCAELLHASSPDGLDHSSLVSDAFILATVLMERLQRERYPELREHTRDLRGAAVSLRPEKHLAHQEEAVRDFFRHAGTVVQGMTTANSGQP